eukprot:1151211-Pelagomonas_calceolata.AAC.4
MCQPCNCTRLWGGGLTKCFFFLPFNTPDRRHRGLREKWTGKKRMKVKLGRKQNYSDRGLRKGCILAI